MQCEKMGIGSLKIHTRPVFRVYMPKSARLAHEIDSKAVAKVMKVKTNYQRLKSRNSRKVRDRTHGTLSGDGETRRIACGQRVRGSHLAIMIDGEEWSVELGWIVPPCEDTPEDRWQLGLRSRWWADVVVLSQCSFVRTFIWVASKGSS